MYCIYICIGDKGIIVLYGGSCIEKDYICVEVYGIVDELIFQLGVCYVMICDVGLWESLYYIQQMLFVLGVELVSDVWGLICLSQMIGEEEIIVLEWFIDCNMVESGLLKQFVILGRNFVFVQLYVVCIQFCWFECLLMVMDCVYLLCDVFKCYSNCLLDVLFFMV